MSDGLWRLWRPDIAQRWVYTCLSSYINSLCTNTDDVSHQSIVYSCNQWGCHDFTVSKTRCSAGSPRCMIWVQRLLPSLRRLKEFYCPTHVRQQRLIQDAVTIDINSMPLVCPYYFYCCTSDGWDVMTSSGIFPANRDVATTSTDDYYLSTKCI